MHHLVLERSHLESDETSRFLVLFAKHHVYYIIDHGSAIMFLLNGQQLATSLRLRCTHY